MLDVRFEEVVGFVLDGFVLEGFALEDAGMPDVVLGLVDESGLEVDLGTDGELLAHGGSCGTALA